MENQNLFDLRIDDESASFLKEISKWGRFLSILSFIVIGFYILVMLFVTMVGSIASTSMEAAYGGAANPMSAMFASGVSMVFMIIYMALLLIPVVYLYRFPRASKMRWTAATRHW